MGRFDGATVLITGAAGGLGWGAAKGFAAEGAKLVLSDIDEKALVDLAGTMPVETAILAGNIADESLSEDLVRLAVEKFGRLDIAVNNAGIVQSFVRLPQVESGEARRVLEVDLLGLFYAMKHQIPQMERQFKANGKGGAIVNIASVAEMVGAPKLSVYAAAKHGVVGLTKSAAAEYTPRVCGSTRSAPPTQGRRWWTASCAFPACRKKRPWPS
jgi:NAD(P)-dependent dehydrogenase (short-subunit alcohol dehydrogenase family)